MTDSMAGSGRRAVSPLTTRLGLAILLILVAGGVILTLAALAFGKRAAQEAYDRLLIGAANQIAASIQIRDGEPVVDIPVTAFDLLALAREERIAYRVIDQSGATLTGYDHVPVPPEPDTDYYWATILGEPVRLAAVRRRFAERSYSGTVTVLVGHTTRARDQLAAEIIRSALIVLGVSGLSMAGLAVFAIVSALRPLRRIERSLTQRDPNDLTPLDVAVPRETQAIVHAINGFMAKLDRQMGAMRHLIADSAHQLRTPIAALRAQAELAAEETDSETQRAIVDRIHKRAVGLSRLTEQLLNRALIIHRADSVVRQRLDLRAVAIQVAEENDHELFGHRDELRLNVPEEAVWIRGDALSLAEASKNLVNNAFRHGAPPVGLRVETDLGHACLIVCDHGQGIPEEHWSDAGRRFGRSATSEGAGLGLAIVRAVACGHSGELRFARTLGGRFEALMILPLDEGP